MVVVDLCQTGQNQSPIEINTISPNILSCVPNCDLKFFYKSSKLRLFLGESSVSIQYDPGSYILYNQTPYSLNSIQFYKPAHVMTKGDSSFVFNGEAVLYHVNPDSGRTVALSVMLTTGSSNTASMNFINAIPQLEGNAGTILEQNMSEAWNAYQLIPSVKSFFKYEGSLLISPCSENITWIVFEYEVEVPVDFINELNERVRSAPAFEIKPLNGRTIYYNMNDDPSSTKNNITNEICITPEKLDSIKEEERKKYERVVSVKSSYEQKKMGYIIAMSVLLGVFILFLISYKIFTKFSKPKTTSASGGASLFDNATNVIKVAAQGLLRTTQEINQVVN